MRKNQKEIQERMNNIIIKKDYSNINCVLFSPTITKNLFQYVFTLGRFKK